MRSKFLIKSREKGRRPRPTALHTVSLASAYNLEFSSRTHCSLFLHSSVLSVSVVVVVFECVLIFVFFLQKVIPCESQECDQTLQSCVANGAADAVCTATAEEAIRVQQVCNMCL